MSAPSQRCGSCGEANDSHARFCASCGASLGDRRADTVAVEVIVDGEDFALDRSQFHTTDGLLIVTRGPNLGARYALDTARVTIGRHPDSDIFLDDVAVSRRHAELVRNNAIFTVRDASSLNGTYLNGRRIDEATMVDGDELQVGKFKFVFFHGTKR